MLRDLVSKGDNVGVLEESSSWREKLSRVVVLVSFCHSSVVVCVKMQTEVRPNVAVDLGGLADK